MNTLAALLVSLWIVVVALGIGRGVRELLRVKDASTLEKVVVDASLGLGVVSLALFAAGSLQLFRPMFRLVIVLCAVSVVGIALMPRVLREAVPAARGALRASHSASFWIAAALLAALAVSALIPALAPPSMSDWDSLAYHLAVPKLYVQHGGIYYIPFTSHSNFPFLVEMLYVPGLALGLPVAAKLMHYWLGVLLIAAVVILVRRHFTPKAAPLAAIAAAGMPIVLWEATTAYIDLATALYTVLAVHLFLNYLDTLDQRRLIACGAAVGFAASTKMTGLALIPLLALWLLIDRLTSDKREFEWAGVGILVGVAGLVCAPWYVKSWIYTGNPVYPFFYSIFGGRDWTAALAGNYSMLQSKFGVGHDFGSFVFLPYDLTFNSHRFYDTPGLYVGPIFLVAVPLLLLARYSSRKLTGMLGFFVAQVAIWFALTQQSRYLIPAFAVLAVLVAVIAYQDDRFRISRGALWAVFSATALFGIWTLYPAIVSAAPVVFGGETKQEYLSRTLDVYPAQQWMDNNLPENARVALYGDTRGFYLDRAYVWADPGHNAAFSRRFNSVQEYVQYLEQRGITCAMVNFRFFPPPDEAEGTSALVYDAIDDGEFQQVYPAGGDFGSVAVYEIR